VTLTATCDSSSMTDGGGCSMSFEVENESTKAIAFKPEAARAFTTADGGGASKEHFTSGSATYAISLAEGKYILKAEYANNGQVVGGKTGAGGSTEIAYSQLVAAVY
jgi:hypothetical protein